MEALEKETLTNEKKFIQLAKEREAVISRLKEINEMLDPLMEELGEGTYLQCEEGLVFKIQKWKGQFVVPKNLEFVRTKREEEKRGTLSKKEAIEAGFEL